MSERGSFVTSYIYCDKCLEAVKLALLDNSKELCSIQIPTWHEDGNPLPVIAGKVGGSYPGEEIYDMEARAAVLSGQVCHQVRIAVMADSGAASVVTIRPGDWSVDCETDGSDDAGPSHSPSVAEK